MIFARPQVFRQNRGVGAIFRPDIHKPGLALGAQGVVIDDGIVSEIGEKLVMAGLGVHQGKTVEFGRVDLVKRSQGYLQEFDHGLILGPGKRPDGSNDTGNNAPPQEPF